jgi:hypothetical protein
MYIPSRLSKIFSRLEKVSKLTHFNRIATALS